MQFTVKNKGALIISMELALLCAVVSGIVAILFFWLGILLGAVCLLACILLYFRMHRARVCISETELTLHKGVFFPLILRIPVRFLTACHILQTPLQRAFGVCVCVLISSGTFALLLGANYQDAMALYTLVRDKQEYR